MSDTDPKALLAKAKKQITTAKDALAETDRIERLKTQLSGEQEKLLRDADPEDRAQMRQLGEIQAQLLVIPRRIEVADDKQRASIEPMLETAEQLQRAIGSLLQDEAQRKVDEIEALLLPYCPKYTDGQGQKWNPARGLAGQCGILNSMSSAATSPGSLQIADLTQFSSQPKTAIPRCVEHLENLQMILETYYANGKSFISEAYKKLAKQ